MEVKDNVSNFYPTVVLDYPDTPSMGEGTITFGNFGLARMEVFKAAGGMKFYQNFQISAMNGMMVIKGILSKDGKTMTTWGMWNHVESYIWQSEEDLKILKDQRDHVNFPKVPDYVKIQPENQGLLVWLSGPPGAGKSTTAQLMGRNQGFVYYEADCTMNFSNPFVDPNVANPTSAAFRQEPLKVRFCQSTLNLALIKNPPALPPSPARALD